MARLSILDTILFGVRRIFEGETELPERPAIRLLGAGVTVTDHPGDNVTDITIPGVEGAVLSISCVAPLANTGTAEEPEISMTGVISDAQHGSRAGGTLHAAATTSVAGFMSATDKTKVDGLPAPADAATITYVDDSIAAIPADAPTTAQYVLKGTSVPGTLSGAVAAGALAEQLTIENASGSAIVPLRVNRKAATGSIEDVLDIGRTLTTGIGSSGTGARVPWYLPDASGADQIGATWRAEQTAVGGGAGHMSVKLVWATKSGAVLADQMTLAAGGALRLHAYTSPGLVANDVNGNFASLNPAFLSNGAVSGVSNAVNINALSNTLSFAGNSLPPIQSIRVGDASDDTVLTALYVDRYPGSGIGEVGCGPDISFGTVDDDGSGVELAAIAASLTDAATASPDGRLEFYATAAGTRILLGTWDPVGGLSVERDTITPRVVAAAYSPASVSNAVEFRLDSSQNIEHTITEDTTVSFSGATPGQSGTLVFSQDGTGRTITMPTASSTIIYSNALAALGVTAMVSTAASVRTIIQYYVMTGSKILFFGREVLAT